MFKEDRNEQRAGRPWTAGTHTQVGKVKGVDRRLNIAFSSEETGCSVGIAHITVTEDLAIRKVDVKVLSEEQNFEFRPEDEVFHGDETWYYPEMK